MPIRLVKKPILVVRDGKQVSPEVGKPFELTANEVKEINDLNPSAIEIIETPEAPAAPASKK